MYELNFEDHLIPVLEGVHAVPNLLTLGRHGLFLNNSMDDNVLLGMKVADQIAARRLRQPRLAVRDARVHEPAVRGEVSGRSSVRDADGREQQHDRLRRQRLPRLGQQREVHGGDVERAARRAGTLRPTRPLRASTTSPTSAASTAAPAPPSRRE